MSNLYQKYYKNGIILSLCLLFTPVLLIIGVPFGTSFETLLIAIAILFGIFALIINSSNNISN